LDNSEREYRQAENDVADAVKRGDAAAEKRHVKPLPKLNQHGKHESCNERRVKTLKKRITERLKSKN
jgi:hypothetical protein